MILRDVKAPIQTAARAAAVAMLCAALSIGQSIAAQANDQKAGEIKERIVQVQSKDDVADAGALFTPPEKISKPIAVIWIHGATLNFYSPTYLAISRGLAKRGYTVITGNTRMHDLGNVEAWPGGKRIRGGTYWGIPSEQVRDIAAWIDFAEGLGFKQVVLVGHSAGGTPFVNIKRKHKIPALRDWYLLQETSVPTPGFHLLNGSRRQSSSLLTGNQKNWCRAPF
jgi:hypothetical protein